MQETPAGQQSLFIDHPSQKLRHVKPFPDRLHVIAVISNALRRRSLMDNFQAFEKRVVDAGGILYKVELALGDREFELIDPHSPRDLGLRSYDELWHKESMIRTAVQQLLPNDFERMAWIDADVSFARADIMQETLHQLEHYHFVQMFSHAQDLGPNYEPLSGPVPSFFYEWIRAGALDPRHWNPGAYDKTGGWTPYNPKLGEWKICHPGLAWACSREAYNWVGGLFDVSIFGSGDWIMANALVGRADLTLCGLDPKVNEFARSVMAWQDLAERYVHRDVGYVDGLVYHYWHGKKADRKYHLRPSNFLTDLAFDPRTDIRRDHQGLYQLNTSNDERSRRLRDTLRMYARARNEDSNEV